MLGKLRWAALAALVVSLTSGCRICERWYERTHEPQNCRPGGYFYGAPAAPAACPPGCAPVAPACPPGCAPAAGYGSGFAPAYGGGCP